MSLSTIIHLVVLGLLVALAYTSPVRVLWWITVTLYCVYVVLTLLAGRV
jgi:hypothetical protein